jgi:predicted Zn-ribbon and HTH transcriptional regulator
LVGQKQTFGLFLIVSEADNDHEVVVMIVPARCRKCGGPVFSMGMPSGNDLCVSCARREAARKMSFTLE